VRNPASIVFKLSRRLRLLFGTVALVGMAIPAVLTQTGEQAGAANSTAGVVANPSKTNDVIEYNQQTGNSAVYYSYLTAGSSSSSVTDAQTSGGGCGNGGLDPIVTSPLSPLLAVTGANYASGYPAPQVNHPLGNGTAAGVATAANKTGVCNSQPGTYQINPNSALNLQVGSDSHVAGRLMAQGLIDLSNNSTSRNATVELVESTGGTTDIRNGTFSGGTVVGYQVVSVPMGAVDAIADTSCGQGPVQALPAGSTSTACTSDAPATAFDTVQVAVLGSSASSVTVHTDVSSSKSTPATTSMFFLTHNVCAGQTLSTSGGGQVSANVSLSTDPDNDGDNDTKSGDTDGDGPICKAVSQFSASSTQIINLPDGEVSHLSWTLLAGNLSNGAHFTLVSDYGAIPYCRPDFGSTPTGTADTVPVCPPTWISIGDPDSDGTPDSGTNDTDMTNSPAGGPCPIGSTPCVTDDFIVAPFCSAATNAMPFCLTNRSYTYVTINNQLMTDIKDTFDGIQDGVGAK
jgi:hypothetical protein